jgi:hypothetical protein
MCAAMRIAPLSLAFVLVVATSAARAQEVPPDVVRTKDGGMMRGTIIEKVPGDHLEITLPNGQSRTVKMSEVIYAGPVSADVPAAPPPPPPAVTQPPTPGADGALVNVALARLELKADQGGVTFHRKTGSVHGVGTGWAAGKNGGPVAVGINANSYERLCTSPCAVDVAQGTYRLGLSLDDGEVIAADRPLDLRGRMRLDAEYVSNTEVRVLGWVLAGAGAVAGAVLMFQTGDPDHGITTHPYAIHGGVVVCVSLLAGTIMGLIGDRATVRATPLK